jgi:hypothetical protein
MKRELPVGSGSEWDEALEAFDDREDLDDAECSVDLFEEIAAREGASSHAFAWVARTAYYAGDYQLRARDQLRFFERGWKAGRRAIERDEAHIGARFWTAVTLAAHADLVNIVKRATFVPEILSHIKVVWDREPEYFRRGAARLLGQAIVRQPTLVSKLLPLAIPGVGADTAIDQLQIAIAEGPPVVFSYQTLGQLTHAVTGDTRTPRAMLDALDDIDLDAAADLRPENHRDLPRAREILGAMT